MMRSVPLAIDVVLDLEKDHGRTIRMANKFRLSQPWAIQRRLNFLKRLNENIRSYPSNPLHEKWLNSITRETRFLKTHTTTSFNKTTDINDSHIEQARNYPITELIDFNQGKALAWCHDDNNPSLTHMTRTNRARCFVCDKSFNAIDVLVGRDGYSFIDAVRALI